MHRCVCIWQYILQNYDYKLHFQNLSIYHIPHVFIRTLAAENLDVCTACDPWDSNIQLTIVKDRRRQYIPNVLVCLQALCGKYILGLLLILISKFWGCPPRARHAFPRHMRKKGGLFISARVFFFVWCHPWMDDETNGWMESFTKNYHNVLTICNGSAIPRIIWKMIINVNY